MMTLRMELKWEGDDGARASATHFIPEIDQMRPEVQSQAVVQALRQLLSCIQIAQNIGAANEPG